MTVAVQMNSAGSPASALADEVTPEQLLTMPDSQSMELVNGVIVEKSVSEESSQIELWIASLLLDFVRKHPTARVYPASLGYRVFVNAPEKIRKPDVSIIALTRLATLPKQNPGFMPIVPDLAVEVVSPNDTVLEVETKLEEYQQADFPLVWLVYPKSRTVTVCPLGKKPFILTSGDDISADAALPGFVCKVSDFFPPR